LCMTPFDFGYTVEEHGLPHIFACGHSSEIWPNQSPEPIATEGIFKDWMGFPTELVDVWNFETSFTS
jgi:hypothetical protein